MVVEELSPYVKNGDARAAFDGPSLMLDADRAQAMAMALHELTTNAVKYGALSTPEGRITVEWWLQPNKKFDVAVDGNGRPACHVRQAAKGLERG